MAACSTATERNERHTSSGTPVVPLVAACEVILLPPRTNAAGAARTLCFPRMGQSSWDPVAAIVRP